MRRLLAVILLLTTGAFAASDVYISPTGNDSTGDGSSGNPYQTFSKGYTIAASCDNIILKAGTYTESVTGLPNSDVGGASVKSGEPKNGNSGTPCWTVTKCETAWSATKLDTCTFNATGATLGAAIFLGNSTTARNYVKFQDIYFINGDAVMTNGDHDFFKRMAGQCDQTSQGGCMGTGPQNAYNFNSTYPLFEDVAAWGHNMRSMMLLYRAQHGVFRRAIMRQNGCFATGCNDSGGVVGQTVYSSIYGEIQNVISLDHQDGDHAGGHSCDFCTAWQPPNITAGPNSFGGDAWRGVISLNSVPNSFAPDTRMNTINGPNGDGQINPMWTYENIVGITANTSIAAKVWGVSGSGASGCQYANVTHATSVADAVDLTYSGTINTGVHVMIRLTTNSLGNSDNIAVTTTGTHATYTLPGAGTFDSTETGFLSTCPEARVSLTNATFYKQGGASTNFVFGIGNEIRTSAPQDVFNNIVTLGNAQYQASFSINLQAAYKFQLQYANLTALTGGIYNNGAGQCVGHCSSAVNPLSSSPIALKFVPQIEATGFLHNAGLGGTTDIGANVLYQYGCDGCFWGDPGYATLTATPLWPYPYEVGIKTLMCADDVTSAGAAGTRDFCSTSKTITQYVWDYLGNLSAYDVNTSIGVPTNSSLISGSAVTVSASVSGGTGPYSTQFLLDGANLGAPQVGASPSISWNSTLTLDGLHTLSCTVTDANSTPGTCASVPVTVNNTPRSLTLGNIVILGTATVK